MSLPLISMPAISGAAANAVQIANPANWAAPPVGTHPSWQTQLPGAKIASGHILSAASGGQVAIAKDGKNVSSIMPVSSLVNNTIKNNAGKIIFSCCNIQTSGATTPAATSTTTTTTTPVSTGASAGELLTGVGSILSALAAPAAGIFQTYTESKLAKAALKREQQQMPSYVPTTQPQVIQQGPSTGLILGLVGGFAAIALILVLVLKK